VDGDLDFRDFDGICRLFPLPGVVLFPHAVLPLHIFEPRYRQMTEDALAGDRRVAVVQVRDDADWSGPEEPAIEPIACLGRILSHRRLPDGRFNFLVQGRKRIRILREIDGPTLYRRAEVAILDDVPPSELEEARRPDLIADARLLAAHLTGLSTDLEGLLSGEPPLDVLTDLLSSLIGFPPPLKQALLAECRVDRRSQMLRALLRQVVSGFDAPTGPSRPFPPPFSDN
jgi:Lon protease-like protein